MLQLLTLPPSCLSRGVGFFFLFPSSKLGPRTEFPGWLPARSRWHNTEAAAFVVLCRGVLVWCVLLGFCVISCWDFV